ncbi:hypothetical protein G5B01_05235 [Blautia wexlerae]|uniref:Type I restriction modification DNA specificity domain-containing protein n=4 Tax=Blautia wexlerae TaxID=418240 RepID=A0A6L8SYY0_9FIRM|nr:restriction endonuclease subunit S [Blautia wexlerae]MDB6438002.1 restriction endonuclease subunit S [Blautia wexlerae]MDB6476112.1 restriction endonuclease subunit S [Blautia wexlerae]MZL32454.1 hypothetical protein [Blautia wexlerae]MZT14535.1 hypothetical protein [Blautia wexlerae]MZT32037.1 hypothetical protein [Blautia wexlerae]
MEKYKLGDICEIVSGSTPKTNIDEYWEGTIKWITPAELNDDTYIITDSVRKITELAVKKTGLKSFPEGTVILSSRAPIGKVAIAGCEMYCNQGFKNLICSKKINNKYLYWFLKGNTVFLNSLGRGATFKELSKSIVSNIEINLPDIVYQKKAVETLEKVSEIIALRKRELSSLDDLIKARFVEMFGNPATPGDKFKTCKLGEVADVKSSHRVFTTEFVAEGVPFYRGTEIGVLASGQQPEDSYRISMEHYRKIASDDSKPMRGDLLLPSICNKGQVWMVDTDEPFYYKDGRVLCISPERSVFDSRYLQFYMKLRTEAEYPKLGSGSTFAEFKIFQLKELEVDIPPMNSQKSFDLFADQVDKSKVAIQKALDKTQMLFDSLMQEYFG